MKYATLIATTAAAFAAPLYVASAQTAAGPAPVPSFKSEKCYGVGKAGANDCQTMTSSCAGTARRDLAHGCPATRAGKAPAQRRPRLAQRHSPQTA